MTDPRDLLRAAATPFEVDLPAVHGRARQIARRRRATAGTAGVTALVAVLVVGGLALEHSAADEQLRPPPVAGTPAPTSAPPSSTPSPTGPPQPPSPATTPPPSTPRASSPVPTAAPPTAGAGTAGPRTTGPRTTGPATTRAATTGPATPAPPFSGGTSPDVQEASGGQLSLVGIRTGRQDGYDRVVYELSGPTGAVPGWRVEYVDQAVADPSGLPVQVRGSAVLQVLISSLEPAAAGGRQLPTSTRLLREVVPGTTFEGLNQSFLGLSAEAPFRVLRLASPTRIVVDVLAP